MSDGELQLYYRHVDPPVAEGGGVDGTFSITYEITSHTDGGEVQVSETRVVVNTGGCCYSLCKKGVRPRAK